MGVPLEQTPYQTSLTASTSKLSPSNGPSGPRLPTELLLRVFLSPSLSPILSPTPLTHATLQSLLATSRLARHCANQQLYEVLILPRRVREFRKYYDTERDRGWKGAARTRGLFCALDDVSRLTHTSAGWETAFIRILHILGPSINHLSLWHSESRTLLRDAGQIRSKRNLGAGDRQAWAWGDEDDSDNSDSQDEDGKGDQIKDVSRVIRTPEERAAMRERARQQLPNWLQAELSSSASTKEVARRHRAHLLPLGDPSDSSSSDLLESHLVAERRLRLKRDRRLLKGCRPTSLSIILSLPLFESQEPALFASIIVFSRCEELEVYIPVPAHTPKLLYLLSHLHRSPLKRIKISTNHFSLCMGTGPFDRAGAMKRKARERQDRKHKRLLQRAARQQSQEREKDDSPNSMAFNGIEWQEEELHQEEKQKWPINLATSLRLLLESETVRQALLWEFTGKHYDRPERLERVLMEVALRSQDIDPETFVETPSHFSSQACGGESLADMLEVNLALDDHSTQHSDRNDFYLPGQSTHDDVQTTTELLRVRIFQGNQGGCGKMKERREDFIERSLGLGSGIWGKCGLWDDG